MNEKTADNLKFRSVRKRKIYALIFAGALLLLAAVLTGLWAIRSSAATTLNGSIWLYIQENGVTTSKIKFNLTTASGWTSQKNVTVAIDSSSVNGNSVKLGATTVQTQLPNSTSSTKTIINIPVKYTQKAYYNVSSWGVSGNNTQYRIDFDAYNLANDGASTLPSGYPSEDKEYSINMQFHYMNAGLDSGSTVSTMKIALARPTYTATLNGNGGKTAAGSTSAKVTALRGSKFTLTNSFLRDGYIFEGWGSVATGSSTLLADKAQITAFADAAYYAYWKVNTYTVQYEANGGTGSMDSQTMTGGLAASLSTGSFARPGYTFAGWSSERRAVAAEYTDGQTVTDIAKAGETAILYAVWKKTDASWQLDNVVQDERMFSGDGMLTGGAGTPYDTDHTDSSYARVDSAKSPGYLTHR